MHRPQLPWSGGGYLRGIKKNDLPPCARHCALLPSLVLEDGTFSSLQEATSFVVDLQVTMIAVTHARDKAKASIASDMQVDQPDL